MAVIRLQGVEEKARGFYYEFNPDTPPLGEGGMGRVYEGRKVDAQTGKSQKVAIKFMYSDLPEHVILRARREASIQIRHNNLVEMLGFIETETRTDYGSVEKHFHVVSELLDGVILDDLLGGKITNRDGKIIPLAEKLYNEYKNQPNKFAITIVKSVLSGLMALHDAGYIHRDIDPTNIMITSDGHIKLIDFGIAKKINTLSTNDRQLTVAGEFLGKPEYASPELVLGDVKSQGLTTDIYAMGMLMYQCVVGKQAFTGPRRDVLHHQLHTPTPIRDIKYPKLRKIIKKATEKSQFKRYQNAAEFRVAIEKLPLEEKRIPKWRDLQPKTLGIIGGASAAAVVVLILLLKPKPDIDVNNNPISGTEVAFVGDQFAEACHDLKDPQKAAKAINALYALADEGNSDASFLLSRLYFKSNSESDVVPDSISRMREVGHFSIDNARAHQLLEQAIDQKESNYPALYELACDYYAGHLRDPRYERDSEKANALFEKALKHAQDANDEEFIDLIQTKINQLRN